MKNKLERYWINAPSTLQVDHKYHGTLVLVHIADLNKDYADAYLTKGDISSMRVATITLSPGWPKEHHMKIIISRDTQKPITLGSIEEGVVFKFDKRIFMKVNDKNTLGTNAIIELTSGDIWINYPDNTSIELVDGHFVIN